MTAAHLPQAAPFATRMQDRFAGRALRTAACATLGAVLHVSPAHAAWDVTIAATGSSSGGAWSGDTWTASASGARVLASEVQTHLTSGATVITTGSGGSEYGDIYVDGDITWSVNALTLNAAHDVNVDGALIGTNTATLVVEFGQGAVADGNSALYRFNTPVKLAPYAGAQTTPHLSLKRGSDGTVVTRAVPACSGRPGGCPFFKNSPGVTEAEYHTVEVDGAADSAVWAFLDFHNEFPTTWYPYVMECMEGIGKFYYPRDQEQKNYFDASGNITNLAGLETVTTTTRFCKNFADGPILSLLSSTDFPYGYYIKFVPTAGAYGNAYNHLSVLVTTAAEANTTYKVYDYLVNIRPDAPTAAGAADLTINAPATSDSTGVTVSGSGTLTVSATSSNVTLLPNTNITGADVCTAAGACAFTVTPAAGQYGTATVTVTVTDEWGQQATDAFAVAVIPPPPAITGQGNVNIAPLGTGNTSFNLSGTGVLTVTATSSDPPLLLDSDITGADACTAAGTCTLTLKPLDRWGPVTVTVTVADAWGQQATASFTVNITTSALPPAAPAISGTSDVNALDAQPAAARFTVAGDGALAVSATSSNTALLPDANITGATNCTAAGDCTLTLAPTAGQTGTATVTLTITDAWSQQATASFTLTVTRTALVVYHSNGGTGGVPTDGNVYLAGDSVTVLDGRALSRTGHAFTGWNTQPDGSGTGYAAGDSFAIGNYVTLYAQWKAEEITFSSSGGGAFSLGWLGALMLLVGGRFLRRSVR